MSKIKLISGWSNPGGSTVHHISLTNLLNENGYDCTFYGPQEWHLDKCKSGLINEVKIVEASDILITHFSQIPKVACKKHILSCHETNLFPLSKIDLADYDLIQYVSNSQKKWHSVNHASVIIPPIVEKVNWKNPKNKTAGVVGSIDSHKRVGESIRLALEDGFDKVLLFGEVTELDYFNSMINPYIESSKAVLVGHMDNKEDMYGRVEAIYHSSIRETYGLVEAECSVAGIPFIGSSNNQDILSKEDILERWEKVLN
jgi:hypothetical protein